VFISAQTIVRVLLARAAQKDKEAAAWAKQDTVVFVG
jgi:hypothetical protein